MRAGLEHRGRRSVNATEATAAPATREVRVIDPAWIPLADGTRLCARIWLPIDAERDPVPAVLEYLPYRKDDVTAAEDARIHPWFAAHGYACVRVDIRGSGDSDGLLLDEYSGGEHDEAIEVIAWPACPPAARRCLGRRARRRHRGHRLARRATMVQRPGRHDGDLVGRVQQPPGRCAAPAGARRDHHGLV